MGGYSACLSLQKAWGLRGQRGVQCRTSFVRRGETGHTDPLGGSTLWDSRCHSSTVNTAGSFGE